MPSRPMSAAELILIRLHTLLHGVSDPQGRQLGSVSTRSTRLSSGNACLSRSSSSDIRTTYNEALDLVFFTPVGSNGTAIVLTLLEGHSTWTQLNTEYGLGERNLGKQ